MIDEAGISYVGLLTVTFRGQEKMADALKAIKRLHERLRKIGIRQWIRVADFTRKNGLHFHIFVRCPEDIATGTNVEAVLEYNRECKAKGSELRIEARRRLRNATSENVALLSLWKCLDETLPNSGFGREYDVFPVRIVGAASKYASDKLFKRPLPYFITQGTRFNQVQYSKGFPRAVPAKRERSAWFKVRAQAIAGACGVALESQLHAKIAPKDWAFLVSNVLQPHLARKNPGWFKLHPTSIARLIFEAYKTDGYLRDKVEPIIRDIFICANPKSPHSMEAELSPDEGF